MQCHRLAIVSVSLIVAGALAGCSGGSGSGSAGLAGGASSSNGTLSIGLIDAPVTDAAKICLHITQIDLKPVDGNAITFPIDLTTDLLTLTPDNSATLLDSVSVPAGQYDWVRLTVDTGSTGNASSSDCPSQQVDSYVETTGGGVVPLRVPSGQVRLVSGFTVTADQQTSFNIEWNARKGLVNPVGQNNYMLQPALRIIDMTQYGTLEGTIAMTTVTDAANNCNADDSTNQNYDVGNVVYVYQNHGVTPDDIGGSGTNPIATADAKPNADKTAYTYKTILSPGDYTVAFTCQAANDDPTMDDSQDPTAMKPVTFLMPTKITSGNSTNDSPMNGDITIDNGGDVTVDF